MIINFFIIIFTSSLILFPPLYYGSVLTLSIQLIQLAIYIIMALWLTKHYFEKQSIKINLVRLLPLIILVLLCFFQTINLPNWVHNILSSKSFEIWDNSRNILSTISLYYDRDWFTLSIYPFATKNSLMLVLSYFLFGFFLSRYITNKSKLFIVIIPIILLAVIETAIGFYQSFIVYGITNSKSAHGTFVNKNHYAGLLELLIPILIGLGLSFNKNWGSKSKISLSSLLNADRFKQLIILNIVAATFIALIISKSRMGIMSIVISLIFFFFLPSFITKNYKNFIWFIVVSVLFFILLIFLIDITPVLDRFSELSAAARIKVWKDCIGIITDFHLFGSGLGTFKYIYPLYKENLKTAVDYNYAHNDYIYLLVETGFIGFSCLTAGLIILFKDSIKYLRFHLKTSNPFGFFITLGALCSVVSILIHSLADFNLHIPANALIFTAMIGIIYGINSKNNSKDIVKVKRVRKTKIGEPINSEV